MASAQQMNPGLKVTDLYKIADSLCLSLGLDRTGQVYLAKKVKINVAPAGLVNLTLQVEPSVEYTVYDPVTRHVGLVLHIIGNLYIFIHQSITKDEMTFLVIDKSKLGGAKTLRDPLSAAKVITFGQTLEVLRKGVRGRFYRRTSQDQWSDYSA